MSDLAALASLRSLVTGAGGFIGSNLCRALQAAGAEVHGLLRPGGTRQALLDIAGDAVIAHEVDLRDLTRLRRVVATIQPDLIFHAAVRHAYRRETNLGESVADNVLGLANLLDATAELSYRRLVHLGSFLEYGPRRRPHRESDPLRPRCLRGATKGAATLLAVHQARTKPIVELRLFSVYGPGEKCQRLVPRAIRAALLEEELPLTDRGYRRDLVFVEDVAEACLEAGIADHRVVGQVINVASGREFANEEVVAEVERVVGSPIRTRVGAFRARRTDVSHCTADISRAAKLLDWRPRHDLAAGLAKTVPWVRRQIETA
jgi:nucleoside-diphosphate-sugar epimerase